MKIKFSLLLYLSIIAILLLTSCNLNRFIGSTGGMENTPTISLTDPPILTLAPTDMLSPTSSTDNIAILSINPPMPAGLSAVDNISVLLNYKLSAEQGVLQVWFEQFTDPDCTIIGQSPDGGSTIGGILQNIEGGSRELMVEIPPIALLTAEFVGVGVRLWTGDGLSMITENMEYAICYQVKKVPLGEPPLEEVAELPMITPIGDLIIGSGSISGLVYEDSNENGNKDAGESGRGSIEVRLANSNCTSVITSTTTDSIGNFAFRDVPEGNYCVILRSTGNYRRTNVTAGHNSYVQIPYPPTRTLPEPPPPAAGYCGDGIRQPDLGEQCDPPNLTDCTASCQTYTGYCGNGIVDPSLGEQCDPPNVTDCTASCQIYIGYCGDGYMDAGLGEQCDPPNITDCTASCQIYTGYCGNGILEGSEQCDPPNTVDCTASCQIFTGTCGNGILEAREECDPPDTVRCTASCLVYE